MSRVNLDAILESSPATFSLETSNLDIDATPWKPLEHWRTTASDLPAEAVRQ